MGSKPKKEDRRDIDEDQGHLYDRIKMLYEEGYELEPVLTQGMEDAISIISNLFPPCLKHEFSYHKQSHLITNSHYISPGFFSFPNMKDLLLQNKKLLRA